MAYTIQLLQGDFAKRDGVLAHLQARLLKDGRFRATLTPTAIYKKGGKVSPAIVVKPVRLVKAKLYCGNHPGPCEVNPFFKAPPKKRMTILEWDDWVAFHKVVNTILNKYRCHADVWSTPQDVKGKMWIRKDTKARLRWDYREIYSNYGRTVRVWNQGTPDQFEAG
jgi:hypothetical protein